LAGALGLFGAATPQTTYVEVKHRHNEPSSRALATTVKKSINSKHLTTQEVIEFCPRTCHGAPMVKPSLSSGSSRCATLGPSFGPSFGPSRGATAGSIVVATALFISLFSASCNKPAAPTSEALFASVMQTQNKRLEAVHDVDVEGHIESGDGHKLRFRYAMQQPAFSAGELLSPEGARTRAFIFDGKTLAVVDDGTKTITRNDLSADEEQMLLTLHAVFSPFVCEGWRPPLLKPNGTTATQHNDEVVLSTAVGVEGVKLQRVSLAKDGAFIGKETIADDGSVVGSTTVLESITDPATGLRFPKQWKMLEDGTSGTITLTSWRINEGVDASRFATTVPVGFTER
jgi:outer membrane lipoprotein-sorting protein